MTDGRRRLLALAVTFGVNGIGFPSLLPRYPQLADAVGASEAAFGLVLVGAGLGGLLGSVAAPLLARWVDLLGTIRLGGVALALAVVGVAAAPTVLLLAVAMAALGAADAMHDVAMNEVAVGEQRIRPGSIMGRLHGVWSVGATAGGAIGALLAGLGVPVLTHAAVVGILVVGAQLAALRLMRPPQVAAPTPADTSHEAIVDGPPWWRILGRGPGGRGLRARSVAAGVALGATLAAMVVEITPQEWSSLLLRRELGSSPGVAGLGPVVFSAGILGGRVITDPLVDRLGTGRVLRIGNVGAAMALGAGLLAAHVTGLAWPLLLGLLVAGVGVSADFPLLYGAGEVIATRLDLPTGTGTSAVGLFARFGSLFMPAVIGVVAGAAGLSVALGLAATAGLLAAALLPRLVRT